MRSASVAAAMSAANATGTTMLTSTQLCAM